MRYLVCKARRHDVVMDTANGGVWRWYACLDCQEQWNSYGTLIDILIGGWMDPRPMTQEDSLKVKAELCGVELPPLWRYRG